MVKTIGWKAVYEDLSPDPEEETHKEPDISGTTAADRIDRVQTLPQMDQGDILKELTFSVTEGKTSPPARFTEASLLSAMENPSAYLESQDKAMAKTLGETGGLGTVATRADIIEKLFSGFLLEKKGDQILRQTSAPGRGLSV